MSLWITEVKDGVVIASYYNPPMNYFCAAGTRELVELIEAWRDPAIRTVVLTGRFPPARAIMRIAPTRRRRTGTCQTCAPSIVG